MFTNNYWNENIQLNIKLLILSILLIYLVQKQHLLELQKIRLIFMISITQTQKKNSTLILYLQK